MEASSIIDKKKALDRITVPKEKWTPGDEMLFGREDCFNIEPGEAEKLRFEAIKYSFNYQYSNNAFYRNYCQSENISIDDIKEIGDLVKIPKIPDTFFKDYPEVHSDKFYAWLRNTSAADIGFSEIQKSASLDRLMDSIEQRTKGFVFHSSGTSGKFSILVRDEIGSFRWAYAMVKAGLFGVASPSENSHLVFLGPSRTHLAFGRFLAEAYRFFDKANIHYLIDRKITIDMISVALGWKRGIIDSIKLEIMRRALSSMRERIINLLQYLDGSKTQVYIIAPPYEIYILIAALKKRNLRFDLGRSNSVLLTSAGWKTYENERITGEDFRSTVKEFLGIQGDYCRDIYAMSEWHGLAWECEGHYKHIIQCTYPMVLGENLEPLEYGKYGRFAFLDPLSNTFPGFIITGDSVMMLPKCPVCNRTSQVLHPEIYRVSEAENRGCSDLMNKMMAGS